MTCTQERERERDRERERAEREREQRERESREREHRRDVVSKRTFAPWSEEECELVVVGAA